MGKNKRFDESTSAPAAASAPRETNVTPIKAGRKPRAGAEGAEASSGNAPASEPDPAIIVFGKDDAGKAHASWFGVADVELAQKAAGLMRYRVLRVTSPAIRAKALELAEGRIFASGKGFVPFCKMPVYEALEAFGGAFQPPAPVEPAPTPLPDPTGTPQRWEEIGRGSLVLASMGDDSGWFESVVVEARGDDLFVLRWQGWPDDPEFARRRHNIALLPATQ